MVQLIRTVAMHGIADAVQVTRHFVAHHAFSVSACELVPLVL